MNGSVFPSTAEVRQLPAHLRMTIPPNWQDRNGHVNVQFYLTLYELGGYEILEEIDVGDRFLTDHDYGLFDFEHHLCYRAELLVGHEVSGYNRILDMNQKRFHGMYFIINDTLDQLACTVEYITGGIDMKSRKTADFPVELHAAVKRILSTHQALPWTAPRCGAINV